MTAAESETLSQEIEYPDESLAHTRGRTSVEPILGEEGGLSHPVPVVFEERLKPRPTTRATEWVWACRSCESAIFLWSKARPVQCVSGCGSRAFRVLLKQYPNEATDAFLARFAGLEVPGWTPYEPRWDEQGRRLA